MQYSSNSNIACIPSGLFFVSYPNAEHHSRFSGSDLMYFILNGLFTVPASDVVKVNKVRFYPLADQ